MGIWDDQQAISISTVHSQNNLPGNLADGAYAGLFNGTGALTDLHQVVLAGGVANHVRVNSLDDTLLVDPLVVAIDAHAALWPLTLDSSLSQKLVDIDTQSPSPATNDGRGYMSVFDIAARGYRSFVGDDLILVGEGQKLMLWQGARSIASLVDARGHQVLRMEQGQVPGKDVAYPDLDTPDDPCACDDCGGALSPFTYLADLLDFAKETVKLSYGSTSDVVADAGALEAMFGQPFGSLAADCDTLSRPVLRSRIAAEVLSHYSQLRGYSGLTDAVRTNLLDAAHEVLLDELGTTREELRDIWLLTNGGTVSPTPKAAVDYATRLGVEFSDLEDTLIVDLPRSTSPDAYETALAVRFGFGSTIHDPLSDGIRTTTGTGHDDVTRFNLRGIRWLETTDEDGFVYLKSERVSGQVVLTLYRDAAGTSDEVIATGAHDAATTGTATIRVALSPSNHSGVFGEIEIVETTAGTSGITLSVIPTLSARRLKALHSAWTSATADPDLRPVVDPGIIGPSEFRRPMDATGTWGAHLWTMWEARGAALDTKRNAWIVLPQTMTNIESVLLDAFGITSKTDVLNAAAAEAQGEDISLQLEAWRMSTEAWRFLSVFVAHADATGWTGFPDEEWAQFVAIGVEGYRRSFFDEEASPLGWIKEEKDSTDPIGLSPVFFQTDGSAALSMLRDDFLSRWTTDPTRWAAWHATLEERVDAFAAVHSQMAEAVASAERVAFPRLRDTWIAKHIEEDSTATASLLGERLLIDVTESGCQTTTRLDQAILSLQLLVFAKLAGTLDLLTGSAKFTGDYGVLGRSDWATSYESWRARRLAVMFPENLVDATTLRDPSHGFESFRSSLISASGRLEPESASLLFQNLVGSWVDLASLTVEATARLKVGEASRTLAIGATNEGLFWTMAAGVDTATSGAATGSLQQMWQPIPDLPTGCRVVGVASDGTDSSLLVVHRVDGGSHEILVHRFNASTHWNEAPVRLVLPSAEPRVAQCAVTEQKRNITTAGGDRSGSEHDVHIAYFDDGALSLQILSFTFDALVGGLGDPDEIHQFPMSGLVPTGGEVEGRQVPAGGYRLYGTWRGPLHGRSQRWLILDNLFDGGDAPSTKVAYDFRGARLVNARPGVDLATNEDYRKDDYDYDDSPAIVAAGGDDTWRVYRDFRGAYSSFEGAGSGESSAGSLIVWYFDESDGKLKWERLAVMAGEVNDPPVPATWGASRATNGEVDSSGSSLSWFLALTAPGGDPLDPTPQLKPFSSGTATVATDTVFAVGREYRDSQDKRCGAMRIVGSTATDPSTGSLDVDLSALNPQVPEQFPPISYEARSTLEGVHDYLPSLLSSNGHDALMQRGLHEVYVYGPLAISRALLRSGHYDESLAWLRSMYDSGREVDRQWVTKWIALDFDPAAWVARAESFGSEEYDPVVFGESVSGSVHGAAVVMSTVETMVGFADNEFAQDTSESINRAVSLYEEAHEILTREFASPCEDICDELRGLFIEATTLSERWHLSLDTLWYMSTAVLGHTRLGQLIGDVATAVVGAADEPAAFEATANTVATAMAEFSGVPLSGSIRIDGDSLREATRRATLGVPSMDSAIEQVRDRAFGDVMRSLSEFDLLGPSGPTDPAHVLPGFNDQIAWENLAETDVPTVLYIPATVFQSMQNPDPFEIPDIGTPCAPKNPRLVRLCLHIRNQLAKIRSCRDFSGARRPLAPYAGVFGGRYTAPLADISPSPATSDSSFVDYSFAYLIDRATELSAMADQFESQMLRALEQMDNELYSQHVARQQAELVSDERIIAGLQVEAASLSSTAAQQRISRSDFIAGHYAGLAAAGLNDSERKALKAYEDNAKKARKNKGLRILGKALMIGAGAALAGFTGGVSVAAAAGVSKLAGRAIAGGLDGAGALGGILGGAGAERSARRSARASYHGQKASFERREQEWRFQSALARRESAIARTEYEAALVGVQIAEQQRQIAELRYRQALDTLTFLEDQFTNAELYAWMSEVLESVYASILRQATAVARAAERALALERPNSVASIIRADYWVPNGGNGVPGETKGLTGSARLRSDIVELEQFALETRRRKLQLVRHFSLLDTDPVEFLRLVQDGEMQLRTPLSTFEDEFPGHYLRTIEQVDVSIIALTPGSYGIRGTLRNEGVSRLRIETGPGRYEAVTLVRDSESIALSSANGTGALTATQASEGLRAPFVGMGVDTTWKLELPKRSNRLDYSTIADVMFSVQYSARESSLLERRVLQRLPASSDDTIVLSLRSDLPDLWYDLVNGMRDTTAVDVEPPNGIEFTVDDIAPGLDPSEPTVEHIAMLLSFADGAEPTDFGEAGKYRVSLADTAATATYLSFNDDGIISTRREVASPPHPWRDLADDLSGSSGSQQFPDATLFLSMPRGDWHTLFENEEIDDILLVITYSASRLG